MDDCILHYIISLQECFTNSQLYSTIYSFLNSFILRLVFRQNIWGKNAQYCLRASRMISLTQRPDLETSVVREKQSFLIFHVTSLIPLHFRI